MIAQQVRILSVSFVLSLVGPVSAQTLFDVDFEAPTYAVGTLNGQNTWDSQFAFAEVVNTTAAGGSQSVNIGPGSGFHPFEVSPFLFNVGIHNPFWLEAWVYVPAVGTGGSVANFAAGSSIANAFNFGIRDNGVVDFNLGSFYGELRNVGPSVLDKWLRMRVIHEASTFELTMTLVGPGVNETAVVGYSTPSADQDHITIGQIGLGNAYWDDVSAGHGIMPVPEPGAVTLASVGASLLLWRRRTKTSTK